MTKFRIVFVAAMTLFAMGLATSPAHADNDTVYTDDYPFPWAGHTQWWGYGDKAEVCDTEGDGLRVEGGFDYRPPGSSVWTVGPRGQAVGKGDCTSLHRDIPENSIVRIYVCTRDGVDGLLSHCDSQETAADND